MNLTISCIRDCSQEQLQRLRAEHLDQLPEAQELLLEVLVPDADAYRIRARNGQDCGYLLVHSQDTLLEFHLKSEYWVFGETILRQVLADLSLERALVKSFDSLLLSSALTIQKGVVVRGLLVRDYVPRPLPILSGMEYECRVALPHELPKILSVDQDVFTVRERLEHVLRSGQVRLFERNQAIVGFGILRPVVPGRRAVDVAIAVDKPFRGKGYATYMFRDLVQECSRAGLQPTCGCSSTNHASRHLGERVGMVARHRLLEISF